MGSSMTKEGTIKDTNSIEMEKSINMATTNIYKGSGDVHEKGVPEFHKGSCIASDEKGGKKGLTKTK